MQERKLNSWEEFKMVVSEIRDKYGYHEYSFGDDQTYKAKNIILFRGQQCSEWPLQTTLERKTNKAFTVMQYLIRAAKIVHELEAFTGQKWNIPDTQTLFKEVKEKRDELFGPYLPCYDYLVYLRHHGYPSPLLDWSESPYIAAYFAYCGLLQLQKPQDQHVAIFAYIDSIDQTKSYDGGPIIQVQGPYVSTHKRHFIQKAWYTIAAKWLTDRDDFIFCSHHEIFDKPNQYHSQDILIKITLPVSEGRSALKDLDDYNINHFTLFQTEDSLVKALSIKGFDHNDF